MRATARLLVCGLSILASAASCSGDDSSGSPPTLPPVVSATADKTERLLRLAVEAAEAEDSDQLCALGVPITCEMTLTRLATAGLPWPTTPPRVLHQGRFGDDSSQGGYAITVCVGEGDTARVTDFALYDGIGDHQTNLRDPVYWSGDRLDPVVQEGAPHDCDG